MKTVVSFFSAVGFVITTGLMVVSGNSIASTPDGETPANEGVCDILIGATPGLYGLCNAYCEAQDLDSFEKMPPRRKILENYNKKKTVDDPIMPCIQEGCPCWSDTELAFIGGDGMAVCIPGNENQLQIVNTTTDISRNFAATDASPNAERCRYMDLNTTPRILRNFSITVEEAQFCLSQVQQACAGL